MFRAVLMACCLAAAAGVAQADEIFAGRDTRHDVPKLTNVPRRGKEWRQIGAPTGRQAGEAARSREARARRPFASTVDRVARHYGVESALVHAVIDVESAYDTRAVSPRGAVGLMQLMPETAAEVGISNPREPHANIVAGVRHLRRLLERYRGNVELALAAYNAGPAAVDRHGGIPPYAETRDYVRKIRARYEGPGLVAEDDDSDRIVRYVDSRGTVVFTQFPDTRSRDPRSR